MASYKFRLLAFKPSRETFNNCQCGSIKSAPWRIRARKHGAAQFTIGDGRETLNWSAVA